jgi:hypothetical protein
VTSGSAPNVMATSHLFSLTKEELAHVDSVIDFFDSELTHAWVQGGRYDKDKESESPFIERYLQKKTQLIELVNNGWLQPVEAIEFAKADRIRVVVLFTPKAAAAAATAAAAPATAGAATSTKGKEGKLYKSYESLQIHLLKYDNTIQGAAPTTANSAITTTSSSRAATAQAQLHPHQCYRLHVSPAAEPEALQFRHRHHRRPV